jgi:hypothetical protein
LAWGIEHEYFSFNRLDDWTGALTFGPKSQELIDQCAQITAIQKLGKK